MSAMSRFRYHYFALMATFFLAACQQRHQDRTLERGFYYWKSIADIKPSEQQTMQQLQATKLYIKFFDVSWNGPAKMAVPVAKIRFTDSSRAFIQRNQLAIIPTVFITNETMLSADSSTAVTLADQIANLLEGTIREYNFTNIPEIQIDCDWTASTRDKYFALLEKLQQHELLRNKVLSATIRLYQCKYRNKTGVPPVKRGLLMCYNMGNLKDPLAQNSILDPAELEKYLTGLPKYPLPLDIGLPVFSWKVVFRNGGYKGLIQELPDTDLQVASLTNRKGNTYELLQDTILRNYELKKGDLIRQEDSNFGDIIKAASLLNPQLVNSHFSVVLFHLDSLTLHKYSNHELEKIFNSLH